MNINLYAKEFFFNNNYYYLSFFIDDEDEYITEIFSNDKKILKGKDFKEVIDGIVNELKNQNKIIFKKFPIINKVLDNLIENEFFYIKNNSIEIDVIKSIFDKFEYITKSEIFNKFLNKDILINLKNYGLNLEKIKLITNKNIYNVDLNSISPNGNPITIEKLEDAIEEVLLIQKTKKMIKKSFSKKYRFLIDNETFNIIKELVLLNVSSSELNKTMLNKIAKYKNSKSLNKDLEDYINKKIGWNKETIVKKAKNNNCNIIYNKNEKIILKINNYKESIEFGSKQWCISYSEIMFDSYKENGNNDIYFIYDFNKDFKDKRAMIGLTINNFDEIKNIHWKDDVLFTEKESSDFLLNKEIIKKIKYNKKDFLNKVKKKRNKDF